MSKTVFVKDLEPGRNLADIFLVSSAQKGAAKNGPYWKLKLQDATGVVDAVIWSPASEAYADIPVGSFASVQAAITSFNDQPQLKIERLALLDPVAMGLSMGDFVPCSTVPPKELLEELIDMVREHIEHKPLKNLILRILENEEIRPKLLNATGAKTVHHAYVGGLLEHTVGVSRSCMAFCDLYPTLDRQILLAGAILHDIGKAWELTDGVENDYTDEGRLLGHILIGLEKIEPFLSKSKTLEPELILHLKHLIVGHHGEHEFGSPVLPKTPEAYILHHADNVDAKMSIMHGIYKDMGDKPDSPRWSAYNRYLQRNIFLRTPAPSKAEKAKNGQPENQCLLPLKA
ncbi:MAG: HD domain-containing protein [Proteobacteria bacterium]|nr:HD domain-containing protein [Pseudomonadota bacterium]